MIAFETTSELANPAEVVWAHATSMVGVNTELHPWLRMTIPRGADLQPRVIDSYEFGFHSWLLVFRVLPFDRHALGFEAMAPDQRWFHERSSSWWQREWVHRRSIEPTDRGCRLTDRVTCTPRLGLFEPMTGRIVRALFEHRHAKLRSLFG